MPRRKRKQGRLLQKKRIKIYNTNDVSFSVVASNKNMDNAWIADTFSTFEEAKSMVDNSSKKDIEYYVYSKDNRVLYTNKGDLSGKL